MRPPTIVNHTANNPLPGNTRLLLETGNRSSVFVAMKRHSGFSR